MPRSLADLLAYHRKRSGLTQQQLAELAGVGKNLVFDLEHGKQTVRFHNLVKVLRVLNIDLEYHSPLMAAFDQEQGDAAG